MIMGNASKSQLAKEIYAKYSSLTEIFIKVDDNSGLSPIEISDKMTSPEETEWGKLTDEEVLVVARSIQAVADTLTNHVKIIESALPEGAKLSAENQQIADEYKKRLHQINTTIQSMDVMTDEYFDLVKKKCEIDEKLSNMWRPTAERNILSIWNARLKDEFVLNYFGHNKDWLFARKERNVSSEEMAKLINSVKDLISHINSDLATIANASGMTKEEVSNRDAERNRIKATILQWNDSAKRTAYYMLMHELGL